MIVFVSLKDDFHALAVRQRVVDTGYAECMIVESDALVDSVGFDWRADRNGIGASALPERSDRAVSMSDVSVVWWRRYALPQLNYYKPHTVENDFATSEWRRSVFGAMATGFHGRWISDPAATTTASNKLVQLDAAAACGWTIPPTVVSQSRDAITAFAAAAPGQQLVVKSLGTMRGRTLAAVTLTVAELEKADVSICPTIYQHLVPGDRHLRINCFGGRVVAFAITTEIMDWRRDRRAAMEKIDLSPDLEEAAQKLLDRLGLDMGFIDAKLAPNGDCVFLEINPQGQFLFLEGATGYDLIGDCAAFFVSAARAGDARPTSRQP